jgi:threonine/homoserine/homoserine lactone efflux protein
MGLSDGSGASPLGLLASFVAGYAAVLATPGPNLLAIGGIAALHGLRGAVPLCAGAALGAGCLGAAALVAAGAAFGAPGFEAMARLAGSLLLGYVALTIAWRPAPQVTQHGGASLPGISGIAAFGAGFCTAATNPLTGAFFAAQFLGPLGPGRGGTAGALAIPCVVVIALLFFLGMASLLARPVVRRAALAWHRPIRLGAAAVLTLLAMNTLWPVLSMRPVAPGPAATSSGGSALAVHIPIGPGVD